MRNNIDYLERDEFTDEDGMSTSLRSCLRCPECGRVAQPDEDVCSECGAPLDYCTTEEELEDDSVYAVDEDDLGVDTSDAAEEPEDFREDEEVFELSEEDETVCQLLDALRLQYEKVHKHHKHSSRRSAGWDNSVQAMFTKWVDSNKQRMARLYYLLKLKNKRMRVGASRDLVEESLSTQHPIDDDFVRACLASLKIKGKAQDHIVMWFHTRSW